MLSTYQMQAVVAAMHLGKILNSVSKPDLSTPLVKLFNERKTNPGGFFPCSWKKSSSMLFWLCRLLQNWFFFNVRLTLKNGRWIWRPVFWWELPKRLLF